MLAVFVKSQTRHKEINDAVVCCAQTVGFY